MCHLSTHHTHILVVIVGRPCLSQECFWCFLLLGHGGDGFLKFQDAEEISNYELGDAFEQMWQKQRCVLRVRRWPTAACHSLELVA